MARYQTDAPAVAVTRPLERDRAVDETGGQIAVFGRLGAGPLYQDDMRSLVFDENGKPWTVTDTPGTGAMIPRGRPPATMAEAEAQEIRSGSQGGGRWGRRSMSTMMHARWIRGLGLLSSLLLAMAAGAELPQYDGKVHEGVASCASSVCHGATIERSGTNVLQNAYVTWTRYDKHAGAYNVLLNEQSKRIARNLGLPNAHEADLCLDCHADNVPEELRGADFDITDGVGCEACHGGSEDWIARHTAPEATHADNIAHGLFATDDLTARTDLCLSCHLGTEDKFATHRIMGAGHPRLSFELSTFTELEPPHWARDADYAQRKGLETAVTTWTTGLLASARHALPP